jgi:hypothetical protein
MPELELIMHNYKIPKGKHTSWNLRRLITRLLPIKAKSGLSLEFEAQIMTEPYDIRPDADQDDRHKLIGFSMKWLTLLNNKNAALVSFQADAANGRWNINPYVNKNLDWNTGLDFPVYAGDKFYGRFKFVSLRKVEIVVWNDLIKSEPLTCEWSFNAILLGMLLPWHGGKDNDKNGIGGVSPVDLNIKLKYKWTRKKKQ